MATTLPTTPQSAPPNFYSQAGAMTAGASGSAQGGQTAQGAGPGQTPTQPDPDHAYLDAVTKLLAVLAKMQKMKPRGEDVSKYLKAAADAIKQSVEQVFGNDGGADPNAGAAGASDSTDTGDPGSASGSAGDPAAAASGGMGASAAGAA